MVHYKCLFIIIIIIIIIIITLKGLAMIFAGQENPFIIFRSKEINICFKTENKIPINLQK